MPESKTAERPAAQTKPRAAHEKVQSEQGFLLDVRGFDEFAAAHAPGAVCIPLPDLERRAGEIPTDVPVFVLCASGSRSAMAAARLQALGFKNIIDISGGLGAWQEAGLPTVRQRGVIPLERQVRGVAGALVLIFSLLGWQVAPGFFFGAGFIGFMLALTSILGICPMMAVLKLMPWNRVSATAAATNGAAAACER